MASSHVFAGVGGYYGGTQGNLKGVFRRPADGADWQHALSEFEAYTVFVHPRDPSLVFAGTTDGVYRSSDHGRTFRRADFPDRGVQIWSFPRMRAIPSTCLPARRRSGSIAAKISARPGNARPIRICRFTPNARSSAA